MTVYLVVCFVALAASSLTLLSGFGLGTLLLPAFALIFPVEIAVSATAIVHLLNNLFKLGLVGRYARWWVVVAFGLPAAAAAFVGAWILGRLTVLPAIWEYAVAGRTFEVRPVKLVVGVLILGFAVLELLPEERGPRFRRRYIPLGGLLSGLFGGLSGHQGALRSAFLIKAGLTKEEFIGTGVACAVLVDLSRLSVYGSTVLLEHFAVLGRTNGHVLVAAATVCAFLGAFVGARMMKKVTLTTLKRVVGVLLILMGAALAAGLV